MTSILWIIMYLIVNLGQYGQVNIEPSKFDNHILGVYHTSDVDCTFVGNIGNVEIVSYEDCSYNVNLELDTNDNATQRFADWMIGL